MLRARIIPCLLIHQGGLVKTKLFKDPKYVGDPINAVKIFNEKEADELMVFDIDASAQGRSPDFALIAKLAAECQMPLCYGGGVTTAAQASRIISMGVEKVAVSTAAIANPDLLTEMANAIGKQSVVAVIDVRKKIGFFSKGYEVFTNNGKTAHKLNLVDLVTRLQDAGAGEIVINSIDRDGMMQGYDIDLATIVKNAVKVPVTVLGGAGSLEHIVQLISSQVVIGAAAGSLFVFKGKYRAVLINYPSLLQKMQICNDALPK